ncbi:MAG: aldo/keto reductase [Magnetococcus sp. YQC-5]
MRHSFPKASLGFGCWGIGGCTPGISSYGPTDDQISLQALERAIQRGITFFDTAPAYGNGHSEALLGEACDGSAAPIFIATKAGQERFDLQPDFRVDAMARVLEHSLQRLRRDRVDLLQLHSPPETLLERPDEHLKWLHALIHQKMVGHFGVSVKTPMQGILAIQRMQPTALQVNFNLMDQRVMDCGLLKMAQEQNVVLIARTPLCFGFLTGTLDHTTRFVPGDHRGDWPVAQRHRWIEGGRAFAAWVQTEGMGVTELALRYPISFAPVALVIPGMLSSKEVDTNADIIEHGPLPQSMLESIRNIYESHNRFTPV